MELLIGQQIVFLMIIFRRVVFTERFDIGFHRLLYAGSDNLPRLFGLLALLFILIENHIPVLPIAGVVAGIMCCPENIQQFAVGDFLRIELDPDRFGMIAE